MSVNDWVRPELIRIDSNNTQKCFFCGEESVKRILAENDMELSLCYNHFKALTKRLHNFHYE